MNDFAINTNDANIERACQLLPAWFTRRMLTDWWHFAFIMANGDAIHIHQIRDVRPGADGALWLDVILASEVPEAARAELKGRKHITAPTDRPHASIAAHHIVAAFETAA